jgi:hypothetical protein
MLRTLSDQSSLSLLDAMINTNKSAMQCHQKNIQTIKLCRKENALNGLMNKKIEAMYDDIFCQFKRWETSTCYIGTSTDHL